MSMEETPDQAPTGADPTAAFSNAIRRLGQQTRSVVDAANAIVASGTPSASDLGEPIAAFRARVAEFEGVTLHLDDLLEGQQEHERQLRLELDALRQADHQRAAEHQRLRDRLYRTQEALRYASASGEALREVDRLLRQEALKVTDCVQTPMLREETRNAHFNAAWSKFLASGRISPALDIERALRETSDEPRSLVTAPTALQGWCGNAERLH